MGHLIYSAWKNGTNRFESYATVQVVVEGAADQFP